MTFLKLSCFFRSHFNSRKPHPLRHSSEGKERKNDVRGVVYDTTTFFGILLLEKNIFFTYLPTHSKFANVTRNNFFIVDGLMGRATGGGGTVVAGGGIS